eukprot:CAMPEP_0172382588 /NCGR_PEP_ID=MMETSP1061-20121228/544_1 /TAXON_ID=37318 /ORGANISM="Pseudo-nitzschia pungens, Strain cf. pungens" /LENGTH=309 /DNA_ID=CAMNT_0013110525 /DNA_START=180 /DNA_END=1109 /DNA_ORIENTATION=-
MATSKRFPGSAILLATGIALIAIGGSDALQASAFSARSSARTGRARAPSPSPQLHQQQQQQHQLHQHQRCPRDNTNSPLSVLKASASDESLSSSSSSSSSPSSTQRHQSTTRAALASVGLAVAIAGASLPANAYIPSDYASETVQNAIQDLKAASGNVDETFKVYENIAGIITEGKGVGGQINYQGIQLERGYVADEDTTIYNPGLSLLTESEKERLVEGVIDARKTGLKTNQWSENNEYAFDFLRQKLDPFHTTELRGYLGIVPYYGAALYLAVLAVQQFFRDGFQVAYLVGVAAFFVPIVGLILAGP